MTENLQAAATHGPHAAGHQAVPVQQLDAPPAERQAALPRKPKRRAPAPGRQRAQAPVTAPTTQAAHAPVTAATTQAAQEPVTAAIIQAADVRASKYIMDATMDAVSGRLAPKTKKQYDSGWQHVVVGELSAHGASAHSQCTTITQQGFC